MELKELEDLIFRDPILCRLAGMTVRAKVPFFLVGGYLRDLCLEIPRKDYDFSIPIQFSFFLTSIEEAFGVRFFKVGKEEKGSTHRTVQNGLSLDIAFLQGSTLSDDLRRRDFTMNTLAFSLLDRTWSFTEGALEDIRNRIIRTVTDRSISQDPLRMLRAVRYVSTLDRFSLNPDLRQELYAKHELISAIPSERIKMELDKILLAPRIRDGLTLLCETGLLFTLLQELKGLEHLAQGGFHHLPVLSHIFLSLEKVPWAIDWVSSNTKFPLLSREERLWLAYALLFHDMGKQKAFSRGQQDTIHFYGHEIESCLLAEKVMDRLRFSNRERKNILNLIREHMRILNLPAETKDPLLTKIVYSMGGLLPLLVLHSLADRGASQGPLSFPKDATLKKHCLRLIELFGQKGAAVPSPFVNGSDLIALGYKSGSDMGRILKWILQGQMEGEVKTKEEALQKIRERFPLP